MWWDGGNTDHTNACELVYVPFSKVGWCVRCLVGGASTLLYWVSLDGFNSSVIQVFDVFGLAISMGWGG